MPINWSEPEVKDRLLAAIIASFEGSINCREVARLYGGEATYNAIENFLRKPKIKAKQLKAEAVGRTDAAPSPSRGPRTPKTPRTPTKTPSKTDGVKSGRVTKTKKNGSSPIKKEFIFDDENIFGGMDTDIDTGIDDETEI